MIGNDFLRLTLQPTPMFAMMANVSVDNLRNSYMDDSVGPSGLGEGSHQTSECQSG